MGSFDERESTSRLDGLWAVVTGASKGIGAGIAQGFVEAGAHVLLVARGRDDLEQAAKELRTTARGSQNVLTHVADTSKRDSIDELFDAIREQLPQLDLFVANAGSGSVVPFLELPREEWDRTMSLNLTGTFLCCQEAARMMVAGPGTNKAILVVSSIRALGARQGRLAYAVTKAGLNQMVRVAALELASHQVRINALSPGITATPLALEGNPEIFAEMAATVPLGRAGTPLDMAAAAVYLCSSDARFVTGVNLIVDGGESLS
jgi:NAD(P)-dependent dehydrogenase (short-subunit alcohol dehydrogenase family)